MKFTFTYEPTSRNNFYKPYYFIDNRRVSENYFNDMIYCCKLKNMSYNASSLIRKNNRYISIFYYD